MPNIPFKAPAVAITSEMEAFFIALAFDDGTAPSPELYGFERHNLAAEIAKKMDEHPMLPRRAMDVRRSVYELGNLQRKVLGADHSSDDWVRFTLKLADAYLNWLYAAGRLRDARMGG